MNFEPAGPLRTSTNLGDRAATSAGRAGCGLGQLRDDRRSRRRSRPRRRDRPARPARRRPRARRRGLARRGAARRGVRAAGGHRPLARAPPRPARSSISRRSASSPAPPSSCRCCTLQRVIAIPISNADDRLRIAIADPGNIHGIDELRLASKYPVDIGVASRDDIIAEIEKIARRSEVLETQSALDDFDVVDETEDDLEVDDGVSDAPLVRLVNSIIMQAATDGASDIHFEPQEDSLLVRVRDRRRAQRGPVDPEADGQRRHDPAEGAREARHRRAAQAAGRPDLARTRARSAACWTSASPCCRRSRASRS